MNFNKVFILLAIVLAIVVGQSEAGWLNDLGKRLERIRQNTRDAAIKAMPVIQQAAALG